MNREMLYMAGINCK